MNKVFLYDEKEERVDKYLAKAAKWIDVIKNNAVYAESGCIEVATMNDTDKKELVNYVYSVMQPIIDSQANIYAKKNNMLDIYDDFKNTFAMEVYENFHKFNNIRYNRGLYFFSFVTFINIYTDSAAKKVKRELFGLSRRDDDNRRVLIKAKSRAVNKYNKEEEDLTVEEIGDCLKYVTKRCLSNRQIQQTMCFSERKLSFREEHIEVAKEDEITFMDPAIENEIRKFISGLRPMQQFVFLQNYEYCSEKYCHMTLKQLSEDEEFIKVCEKDSIGNRNVIDFVEYKKKVDEKFIENQRSNIRKKFATVILSTGCEPDDLSGKLDYIMLDFWINLRIS